jgi:hypothetical protein
VTHAEQFDVGEIPLAGHHLRQHVRARVLPALPDRVDKILIQRVAGRDVVFAENGLVTDDGVLPGDQAVPILQRQTVQIQKHLKRVQGGEVCHRVALPSGGDGIDHVGRMTSKHRQ